MTYGYSFSFMDGSNPMRSSDPAPTQKRTASLKCIAKIEANRKQRRERWRSEAVSLWRKWRRGPLFVLGVGLYWGEGEKAASNKRLALSNADPNLLRTWLRWCARFLPGVRLNFWLCIHEGCDLEAARAFWRRE
jgi:hypothetical protein